MSDNPEAPAVSESVNILGIDLNVVNIPLASGIIDSWIRKRERRYVCLLNVHCIMESRRNPALRNVYKCAGLRTPDGMPLVWISHWKRQPLVRRVYGPDLMTTLCAVPGYRHFLYGSTENVLNALAGNLQRRFPHMIVAGKLSPPFRPLTTSEDEHVIGVINNSRADIVWVALGTPRQDFWMRDHSTRLESPVLVGVGAAFDFLSGHKRQAPLWMQRNGFEWLFRLINEPRRLWRRYLIDNPLFLLLMAAQCLNLQHNAVDRDGSDCNDSQNMGDS